jgi:hypothetical protein
MMVTDGAGSADAQCGSAGPASGPRTRGQARARARAGGGLARRLDCQSRPTPPRAKDVPAGFEAGLYRGVQGERVPAVQAGRCRGGR